MKADPLPLLGATNPLKGSVDLPEGSVITDVLWYAMWDPAGPVEAQKIPLGQTETGDGEVLDEDMTNKFTYGGQIKGHKYNDLDRDGIKDTGEPGLGDWEIKLERKVGNDWLPYASKTTLTSGDIGFYKFYSVLPGEYRVSETLQSGWTQTKPDPGPPANGYHYCTISTVGAVTLQCVGTSCDRDFLNYEDDFKKTFELTYEGSRPANTTFWVTYFVDGVKADPLQLTGAGNPLKGSVDLPPDSVITKVLWYAMWDPAGPTEAQKIPLGQTEMGDGEVMDGDKTNKFKYGGQIKGHKYHDLNGNGSKQAGEPGLGDWEIKLERKVGNDWLPYDSKMTRTTGDVGFYRFYSVLPGEYRVSETLKRRLDQVQADR